MEMKDYEVTFIVRCTVTVTAHDKSEAEDIWCNMPISLADYENGDYEIINIQEA